MTSKETKYEKYVGMKAENYMETRLPHTIVTSSRNYTKVDVC